MSEKCVSFFFLLLSGTGGFMSHAGYDSMLCQQNTAITMAHEISRAHLERNLWKEVLKMI